MMFLPLRHFSNFDTAFHVQDEILITKGGH